MPTVQTSYSVDLSFIVLAEAKYERDHATRAERFEGSFRGTEFNVERNHQGLYSGYIGVVSFQNVYADHQEPRLQALMTLINATDALRVNLGKLD